VDIDLENVPPEEFLIKKLLLEEVTVNVPTAFIGDKGNPEFVKVNTIFSEIRDFPEESKLIDVGIPAVTRRVSGYTAVGLNVVVVVVVVVGAELIDLIGIHCCEFGFQKNVALLAVLYQKAGLFLSTIFGSLGCLYTKESLEGLEIPGNSLGLGICVS